MSSRNSVDWTKGEFAAFLAALPEVPSEGESHTIPPGSSSGPVARSGNIPQERDTFIEEGVEDGGDSDTMPRLLYEGLSSDDEDDTTTQAQRPDDLAPASHDQEEAERERQVDAARKGKTAATIVPASAKASEWTLSGVTTVPTESSHHRSMKPDEKQALAKALRDIKVRLKEERGQWKSSTTAPIEADKVTARASSTRLRASTKAAGDVLIGLLDKTERPPRLRRTVVPSSEPLPFQMRDLPHPKESADDTLLLESFERLSNDFGRSALEFKETYRGWMGQGLVSAKEVKMEATRLIKYTATVDRWAEGLEKSLREAYNASVAMFESMGTTGRDVKLQATGPLDPVQLGSAFRTKSLLVNAGIIAADEYASRGKSTRSTTAYTDEAFEDDARTLIRALTRLDNLSTLVQTVPALARLRAPSAATGTTQT